MSIIEDIRIRIAVSGAAALGGFRGALLAAGAAAQVAEAGIKAAGAAMAALKAPIDLAVDFEREFAQVRTLSDKVGKDLERGLLDLAKRVPFAAADLAKAAYQAISAGVDPTGAVAFLEAASKAAVAGNASIEASVTALTTAVNAFGKQGTTASQASDILFATVKQGVTTFEELNANLGKNAALAAYGVQLSEIGAVVATLTSLGINGATAADRLNAAVKTIATPSPDTEKAFKAIGFEGGVAAIQTKGLAGVLDDLRKKTKGSAVEIAKLTSETEANQALVLLLGDGYDKLQRDLVATTNAAGSTAAAFDIMNDTTNGAIKRLKLLKDDALREIGTALLPAINDAIETMGETMREHGPAMIASIVEIAKHMAALANWSIKAGAAITNLFTGATVTSATRAASDARSLFLASSGEHLATGGVDLDAVAAAGGETAEQRRRALEDFGAARAEIIAGRRADAEAVIARTERSLARNEGLLGRLRGTLAYSEHRGDALLAERLIPEQKAQLERARNKLEATFVAGNALEAALNAALNKLDAAPLDAGGNAPPPPPPPPPPKLPKGPSRPVEGVSPFESILGPVRSAAGEGAYLARSAAAAIGEAEAERQLREQEAEAALAFGRELADRRVALIDDEGVRSMVQMAARHRAELDAVAEFEAGRSALLEVHTLEREALEDRVAREAVRRNAEKVGAYTSAASAVAGSIGAIARTVGGSTRLLAGIDGAKAVADASTETARSIASFATLDVAGGIAHGVAAAAFGVAAANQFKIAATGSGFGGGGGGGGGGFAASRAAAELAPSTTRPTPSAQAQAPNITVILSDTVPLSDRDEIMGPLVQGLANRLHREMQTRGGTSFPGGR